MRVPRRPLPRPAIDMAPMIDCVFQLLIFFMLSASFQAPMIQFALPQATTKDDEPTPEILVTADAKGQLYLNRDLIPAERLEELLRPLVSQSKRRTVVLRGDKNIPYHQFVQVLDAARAAGAVHGDIMHDLK